MSLPESLRAEAAADYYTDEELEGAAIDEEHVHTAFLAGVSWLYSHLANSAPEFDEKATSLSAGKSCTGTQGAHDRDCNKCNGYLKGARWQYEQDKARIALADADVLEAAEAVNKLKAKVKGLVEALEWYANAKNWEEFHYTEENREGTLVQHARCPVDDDEGSNAREALEKFGAKE